MVLRGAYSSSREKKSYSASVYMERIFVADSWKGEGGGGGKRKKQFGKSTHGSVAFARRSGGWDGKETKGAKNDLKKQEEQLLLLYGNAFFATVAKLPSEEKVGEKNTCSNVRSRNSMLLSILMTRCLTLKQHTIGARIFKDKLFLE